MADIEDIKRKQADAAKAANRMIEEKDPQALIEMAEKMKERVGELEKMAKGLAAALTPQEPPGQEVRVQLTPDQKKRIAEQTGVGVEVVTVYDTKKKMWSKEL